jgi:hypothetical protein
VDLIGADKAATTISRQTRIEVLRILPELFWVMHGAHGDDHVDSQSTPPQ